MSKSIDNTKNNYTTISLNIPNDIFQKCTNKAKELGITRTGFINLAISEYLNERDALKLIPKLIEQYQEAKTKN